MLPAILRPYPAVIYLAATAVLMVTHQPIAIASFVTWGFSLCKASIGDNIESGWLFDSYSNSASTADATSIFGLLFNSDGSQLISEYVCSTLSPSNGDDETANISITPSATGLSTEIESACGAS